MRRSMERGGSMRFLPASRRRMRLPGTWSVSPGTYVRLEKAISDGRRFEFDKDACRVKLKQAAAKTGQEYKGSHGLRWSWAQERHAELQERGMTYEQSLSEVSQEMGHERGDITEHYLR